MGFFIPALLWEIAVKPGTAASLPHSWQTRRKQWITADRARDDTHTGQPQPENDRGSEIAQNERHRNHHLLQMG
jgi:hypothetical protein